MKPVDQSTFGVPGGNCLSACIASLLELPIADVPYFFDPEEGSHERLQAWLKAKGFFAHTVGWSAEWQAELTSAAGYHIVCGKSARGPHAVVGHGGEIVHDPHPSRGGLISKDSICFLVPLDPAGEQRLVSYADSVKLARHRGLSYAGIDRAVRADLADFVGKPNDEATRKQIVDRVKAKMEDDMLTIEKQLDEDTAEAIRREIEREKER